MAKYDNPIQKLTFILELFAYGVTVSLYICYVIITANIIKNPLPLLTAAGASSLGVLLITLLIRYVRLSKVFRILNSEKEHKEEVLVYCKKRLLMQPRFEAVLIIFRYSVGVGATFAILNYNKLLSPLLMREIIIGFIISVPIAYTFFILQTEKSLSKYLQDFRLVNVQIPSKSLKSSSISLKIYLLIGSIIIMPIVMLLEIVYLLKNNLLLIETLILPLMILVGLIILASSITSFLFIRQVKYSLKDIGSILKHMSTGFISLPLVPLVSRDDPARPISL